MIGREERNEAIFELGTIIEWGEHLISFE